MEPMVVLTYITDQQNRMVGRTHHFMNGIYMRGRIVHQRHLPAEPGRARRAVQHSAGRDDSGRHLPVRRADRSPTTPTRRRRFYERFTCNPMEFYGGTQQAVSAAVGVRATSQPRRANSSSAGTTSICRGAISSSNLAILRVDYALSPRATVRSLTQYNSLDARSHQQRPLQLHLPAGQRPLHRLQRPAADRPAASGLRAERPPVRREDELPADALSVDPFVHADPPVHTRRLDRQVVPARTLRGHDLLVAADAARRRPPRMISRPLSPLRKITLSVPAPGALSLVVVHRTRKPAVSLVKDSVCLSPRPDHDPTWCHTTTSSVRGGADRGTRPHRGHKAAQRPQSTQGRPRR